MRVIVAGLPKTGTTSITKALEILGYNPVHHFYHNCFVLQNEWSKILKNGASPEVFKKMYENVDAVTDGPACFYWEDISKAFPEAKIILTVRKDEETWYRSLKNYYKMLMEEKSTACYRFWMMFSFSGQKMIREILNPACRIFWEMKELTVPAIVSNKQTLKLKYKEHNTRVIENAPKDQLLIFDCGEGWEPLCRFLGLPEPDEPFPHKNKADLSSLEALFSDPPAPQMRREAWMNVGLVFAIVVLFIAVIIMV